MEKRVIPVLEMSCAVCAATVEKTVRELTGVEEASVNFSANTLQVVYDPDKISLKDMQAAVSAAGYDLVISENAEADAIDAEHRLYLDLRRRTIGAWSFGLPVMVFQIFLKLTGGTVDDFSFSFTDSYLDIARTDSSGVILGAFVLCIGLEGCKTRTSQYGHFGNVEYCRFFSVQLVQYDLSVFSACLLRSGCYDYSFCFVGEIIGSEG